MGCRRLLAAALGGTLAAALALSVPTAALADVDPTPPKPPEFHGFNLTPSQTGGAGNHEWLGSYRVGGEQVWCVNYLYKAPRGNERYEPGDTLRTKWNTPIPADRAADISYLLLRHGDTTSDTEATALAHILHSWTAPAKGHPTRGAPARALAYDANFHRDTMPAGARAKVDRFTAEAAANRGPWRGELTAPPGRQTIGTPANWTMKVVNAKGRGVPGVPVTFTATGGSLGAAEPEAASPADRGDGAPAAPQARPQPGGTEPAADERAPAEAAGARIIVKTGPDGIARVALTPRSEAPQLSATFDSPNQTPIVQQPLREGVQKVVLTGGEKKITVVSTGKARSPVGGVKVTKLDAATGKPIPGASLRITGPDQRGAAVRRDGGKLLGADGRPAVVQTTADGTATVRNLKAPQEICVVEAAAPAGYEQRYDERNPPAACGTIHQGGVLALTLKNKPNERVPITIPAGGNAALAHASTESTPRTWALFGFGGLLLAATGLGTLLVRRR